jgi:transcriptional regulator with XRE-family HTH domain
MGFRENLKNELMYSGMPIKELAEKSGVKKHTIAKYLCENYSIPSADAALRIAAVFGVSVEYLMTGQDIPKFLLRPAVRLAAKTLSELDDEDQKTAFSFIQFLKKRRKS